MVPASAGFPAYVGALIGELSKFVSPELMPEIEDELVAISDQITAVGALATAGMPADFSNAGEVYAPGENLVGWWNGGLAVWSGTSFAAPHFSACLATGICKAP
jgi:subtilisin family serine protease